MLIVVIIGFILFLTRSTNTSNTNQNNNTGANGTNNTSGNTSGQSNNSGTSGNNNSNNSGSSNNSGNSNTSNFNTSSVLTKISDDQVIAPILSFQNTEVWYFANQGQLYKLNLSSGLKQTYILPASLQIDDVIWSADGNDFIAVTKHDDGTKTFNYYNSQTKTYTAYPSNVKEVDFMPQSGEVAYVWADAASGKSQLSVANYDLSGHKFITNMPDSDDVIIVSPIGNKLLAYKNNAAADGKLYYVALDTAKIITIKTGPFNSAIWSKDGEHFVFNKYDSANPSSAFIWLGDIVTGKDLSLGVSTKLTKIVFTSSGAKMYFALAASDGSGDSFWSYDLKTAAKKQLYSGTTSNPINSSNLLVTDDESKLYFKNFDGYLYVINLQ